MTFRHKIFKQQPYHWYQLPSTNVPSLYPRHQSASLKGILLRLVVIVWSHTFSIPDSVVWIYAYIIPQYHQSSWITWHIPLLFLIPFVLLKNLNMCRFTSSLYLAYFFFIIFSRWIEEYMILHFHSKSKEIFLFNLGIIIFKHLSMSLLFVTISLT